VHPVIVKISPLLWCPLLMFCYILLMGPFLMIVNNQSVQQSSKKRMEEKNMTQHFALTVLKTHPTFRTQMSQEHEKATTPFTSMRKCYRAK
jgi:hypothetical protein